MERKKKAAHLPSLSYTSNPRGMLLHAKRTPPTTMAASALAAAALVAVAEAAGGEAEGRGRGRFEKVRVAVPSPDELSAPRATSAAATVTHVPLGHGAPSPPGQLLPLLLLLLLPLLPLNPLLPLLLAASVLLGLPAASLAAAAGATAGTIAGATAGTMSSSNELALALVVWPTGPAGSSAMGSDAPENTSARACSTRTRTRNRE